MINAGALTAVNAVAPAWVRFNIIDSPPQSYYKPLCYAWACDYGNQRFALLGGQAQGDMVNARGTQQMHVELIGYTGRMSPIQRWGEHHYKANGGNQCFNLDVEHVVIFHPRDLSNCGDWLTFSTRQAYGFVPLLMEFSPRLFD